MDVYASNWNEDDNANITTAPDGAPEGMAPSGVNNVLRAHQGAMKRFAVWSIPKTTAGSSTAYTLSYSVAPGALADGMTHLVQFHVANSAAATLTVNGLSAIPIYYHAAGAWRAAPPGLIDVDEIRRVAYHTSSGTYRLLDLRNRTGEVIPFAGSTAPAGALFCFGQTVSRTQYAGLFAAIGTTYGAGDGSTTFALPDLRGRVAAGKDDMGGSSAGRLNTIASTTLGGAGGQQTESAGVSGTAAGTLGSLSVTVSGVTDGPNLGSNAQAGLSELMPHANHGHAFTATGSTGATGVSFPVGGSTATVTNVQPSLILNYAIRI
jgi:microcystin-dependent protein